ncbi:MAG TPA: Zn-ribbon domain-containing OB-fold protein [Candidatus Acidoferrales bacterium]|nr:Zn-ribbon domain-containing OB-fold protein [Candidatus Acidoferrales bacterium]
MANAYAGPIPRPTPESKPFWDAAKRHELHIQHCNDCSRFYFYPRPLCPHCLSRNVEWRRVSGKGKLHTFVINQRPARNFPASGPYVIGIVELDEGARMMSNIVDVEPDPKKLRCDMPVEVVFEEITDEIALPKFRPAKAA